MNANFTSLFLVQGPLAWPRDTFAGISVMLQYADGAGSVTRGSLQHQRRRRSSSKKRFKYFLCFGFSTEALKLKHLRLRLNISCDSACCGHEA